MRDSETLLPSAFVGGSAGRGFDVARLPPVREALARFFAQVALAPPACETVALGTALGRILGSDATAQDDVPAHPRSTMDGYAVRSADGRTPRRIAGDVAMGAPAPCAAGPNEALRVPTGGAMPPSADAVVPQEDCDVENGLVVPHEAPAAGDNVAQRGADIRRGETVLRAGRRIGAPELGVLATLGIVAVPVFARPRIAVVSTGDELVDPAEPLAEGRVRDSNRFAIAAALEAFGAQTVHVPRVADRFETVLAAFRAALDDCAAVVSSGGSSVGDRDLVPLVVAALGPPGPIVHGIRVKPGKPTLLGAAGSKPIVGLPGNPASSLMILEAVVAPIVRALTGETPREPVRGSALATADIGGRPGWTWFVPVRLFVRDAVRYAEPLRLRSSQTSLLARASGYVELDDLHPSYARGERLDVTLFSSGGAPIEDGSAA